MAASGKTIDLVLRVSKMNGRTESAESTMTIDDQRAQARSAVAAVNGRVGREFLALDQSGFTFLHSTELQAALGRVRSGKSDGIAVAYGDRIMRNWWRLGQFFEELEQAGGAFVVSGLEHIDYRTQIGRSVFGGMGQASEQVYFAAKTRGDAIAARVIERGVPNRVPYGYRRNADQDTGKKEREDRDGKSLVVDPVTGPVVRQIFKLRASGHPWSEIAATLNDAGIRAARGGIWTKSSVTQIVKCKTYLGDVHLGGRVHKGAHEALVSRPQWQQAQSTRKVKRNGRLVAGIAGGLVFCCTCQRPMSVIGAPRKSPGAAERTMYGCRAESASGKCPRPTYVSKRIADQYVESVLLDALQGGELEVVSSTRELDTARRTLDTAREELSAYVTAASALDAELFGQGLAVRQEAVQHASDAFEAMSEHAELSGDLPEASAWASLDLEGKRHVARLLVDRVTVHPARSRRPLDTASPDRFQLAWRNGGQ